MRLDLGVLAQETLDITLLDGTIVCIKKPGKGLLIEINKIDIELGGETNFEKIVTKLEQITAKILTNNTEKRHFTSEMLEENDIDYTMQMAIFKAYMQMISKSASNPN